MNRLFLRLRPLLLAGLWLGCASASFAEEESPLPFDTQMPSKESRASNATNAEPTPVPKKNQAQARHGRHHVAGRAKAERHSRPRPHASGAHSARGSKKSRHHR